MRIATVDGAHVWTRAIAVQMNATVEWIARIDCAHVAVIAAAGGHRQVVTLIGILVATVVGAAVVVVAVASGVCAARAEHTGSAGTRVAIQRVVACWAEASA